MTDIHSSFAPLVKQIGKRLHRTQWLLSTAESCTGGLVAAAITSVPGSGDWFDRGFVTYSIPSKIEMLGINAVLIEQYGAVSEQVAGAMAKGALHRSRSQIALAITGVAGPTDTGENKPIGTVCFGWSYNQQTHCKTIEFKGNREQVRLQAVEYGLQGILTCLNT